MLIKINIAIYIPHPLTVHLAKSTILLFQFLPKNKKIAIRHKDNDIAK